MDRRCSRDRHQAGAEAKDGSPGRTAVAATAAGEPLSTDLGTRRGQSGHAAAAVASAPIGADAHAGDESVACGGTERRVAAQEGAVAASRPGRVGVDCIGTVGEPATPGPARLTRPADAEDPGTDACAGTGGREASGDATADDASRSRPADSTSLRVGDRNAGPVSLRQTDRQLCGAGSRGKVQRRSAETGTHQQAG